MKWVGSIPGWWFGIEMELLKQEALTSFEFQGQLAAIEQNP
jgi:hypothetical protein